MVLMIWSENLINTDTIWFTGCTHFFHNNILHLTDRGKKYNSIEEMNEDFISTINKLVKPTDNLYLLGDVVWGRDRGRYIDTVSQLNGYKIIIYGNHDESVHNDAYIPENNSTKNIPIYHYLEVPISKRMHACIFHYPIASFNGQRRGCYHLHSHTHGNWKPARSNTRILDVGMDNIFKLTGEYRPICLTEVLNILNKINPWDHGIQELKDKEEEEKLASHKTLDDLAADSQQLL